jgi:hypothetical protein
VAGTRDESKQLAAVARLVVIGGFMPRAGDVDYGDLTAVE